MKKIISLVFTVFVLLSSFQIPVAAQEAEESSISSNLTERIILFESYIEQDKSTEITITEKIHYYFPTSKHGIFRKIPTSYKVKGGFQRPTILVVKNLKYYPEGKPHDIRDSYTKSTEFGYTNLKIGDKDEYISGKYVFEITYSLTHATNFFDTHDELYLNITGNEWNVPIDKVKTTIVLPGEITKYLCYTGRNDSTEENCSVIEKQSGTENKISFEANDLKTYEGLTAVIAMPKGTLKDTRNEQKIQFLLANIGILLPIPVILFLFFFIQNNNYNKKLTVIPHYNPPKDIYPTLASAVLQNANINKAVAGEIIQLAISGYITIEQTEKKKYILHKENKKKTELNTIQSTLLNGLFGDKDEVDISTLSTSFYNTINQISTALTAEQETHGFLDKRNKNFKQALIGIGLVLGIGCFFALNLAIQYALLGWFAGVLVSAVAILVSSHFVDIRAELGNQRYYELLGLKMYINTAEKHRIEFHNDPKKFSGVFEKLLPYAIIFGLEKKWAEEFSDIYKQPDWYTGDFDTFDAHMLTRSVSNINSGIGKAVTKSYSSSHGGSGGSGFSGGSSGGGFGGGGGGSW